MNQSVELHDSCIASITQKDEFVIVRFSPAYLHISDGVPGIDAGVGCVADLELEFRNGVIESACHSFPVTLYSGRILLGSVDFDNRFPLPVDVRGSTHFLGFGNYGEEIVVRGDAVRSKIVGEIIENDSLQMRRFVKLHDQFRENCRRPC